MAVPISYQTQPTYNVRKQLLDTATTDQEIEIEGDYVSFYTDGTFTGITYKIDGTTGDAIETGEFNPYLGHFRKVYITWTAQSGKYLRVFVGRGEQYRAGVEVA